MIATSHILPHFLTRYISRRINTRCAALRLASLSHFSMMAFRFHSFALCIAGIKPSFSFFQRKEEISSLLLCWASWHIYILRAISIIYYTSRSGRLYHIFSRKIIYWCFCNMTAFALHYILIASHFEMSIATPKRHMRPNADFRTTLPFAFIYDWRFIWVTSARSLYDYEYWSLTRYKNIAAALFVITLAQCAFDIITVFIILGLFCFRR